MKTDRRTNIVERFVIAVALPHHDAFQTNGIGDIAVLVLFDDDFDFRTLLHEQHSVDTITATHRADRRWCPTARSPPRSADWPGTPSLPCAPCDRGNCGSSC